MPRLHRNFDPNGGTYHIYSRGNNKQIVFHNDADRNGFLGIIRSTKRIFPFLLHHYVLMGNHFHFELSTIRGGATPDRILKRIKQEYAIWYKTRYHYVGQLWQGRYGAEVIKTDDYLLTCGFYIELNPVRAGLVARPETYQWSSYRHYALGEKDDLVDDNPLYEGLGVRPQARQDAYKEQAKAWMMNDVDKREAAQDIKAANLKKKYVRLGKI